MDRKDYKNIFHLVKRKDGNIIYVFVIIGDTVSHYRDVLDDEVKFQNISTLIDFCVRRGYRCICVVKPDADDDTDEEILEESAGFFTKFVNTRFDSAGILFTKEDARLYSRSY